MPAQANQAKKTLIGKAANLARKGLRGKRADQAEAFVRLFYEHVPPDDIVGEPAELARQARGLLDFASERRAGQAKLRVMKRPGVEAEGWTSEHTVIEIANDDMPFLVDSVTAALERLEIPVLLVIHPMVDALRDAKGQITAVHPAGQGPEGSLRESAMQVHITEQPEDRLEELAHTLEAVLKDVRAAVADWPEMRQRTRSLIAELEITPPKLAPREIAQGIAFLKWLDDDHFTYLGYREYRYKGGGAQQSAQIDKKSGLGVLAEPGVSVFDGLRALGKLPPDVRAFVRRPELLRISKSNRRSTVHRAAHMDTISVKSFDAKGNVIGERLFVGLFTSAAYTRSPRDIPLLREKVDRVLEGAGFPPNSHDGKALMHILETYPRDELFQISAEDLLETALGILHLQERQRVALFLRRDPFERFVSAMIFVPRDRYDTRLRLELQRILAEAFNGSVDAFSTLVAGSPLARLHIVLSTKRGEIPAVDPTDLEKRLAEAARAWVDRVEVELIARRGDREGRKVAHSIARCLPAAYQEYFTPEEAADDVALIEQALTPAALAMNLYRPQGERSEGAPPEKLHFKLVTVGRALALSDILPMLEHMGLRVIGEVPFEVTLGGGRTVWVHDFDMLTQGDARIDLEKVRDAFHEAFARIWNGRMEDDGFNKLVLYAGLKSREITVLRAYAKYLRQAAIPFSQDYMEETLVRNPRIAALLAQLFEVRFDPALVGDKAAHAKAADKAKRLRGRIEDALEEVSNLDEDRIIRRFLNAIEATLRTNFHQQAEDEEGKPCEKSYISLKFDSQALEELPLPKPFREIFVYAPRFEGVHLRFGKVARGGLRWSDRREDFRTEILGLVKAQQVKNAVIVPVGSKGGFVLKQPPPPAEGREAFQNEGIACYKLFISGLLDLTDNLVGDKLKPPPKVVRWDDDDPYLVVAADKGTATFSDIANGVSLKYGHWLDDAFASGGSAGYDHKKMGITARGAWESVKRHFRERGKNIQEEPFTCIGCGDMSGDVFGNGMLLSRQIRLIGAFNHLHIFVDPDPDPGVSWAERKRLFDLPRSSWTDYDTKLISRGGGVFDRKAKSIKVTKEMKALFPIAKDQVTPNELINAMLRTHVELLWFGGIGTYVKSSGESHLDVGDRANDAIRIDARLLKAAVVGEGANLGMTQRARIEASMHGVMMNTDSIDNSAGVDCSDHEVNIKILLGDVEKHGGLTRKQRDTLLEKMTDEVGELVLRDNYLQTQAITVTHILGAHLLDRLARFMRGLERRGLLDRGIEYLPDDETILERQKQAIGLMRPELAVLLSYAKISVYEDILESDLPDEAFTARELIEYFPTPLRQKYEKEIGRHRLRREIVATVITNEIINRLGPPFVHEVSEKTGMPAAEIARAYVVTTEIFDMHKLWAEIEALDNKVPAQLQATMLIECGRLIEREVVWFLRELECPLDVEAAIAAYRDGVTFMLSKLKHLVSKPLRDDLKQRAATFIEQGVPEDLAVRVAGLRHLAPACDMMRISLAAQIPIETVAGAYFKIGERFGFDWLRRAAGRLPTDTVWDKLAVTALFDDLYGHQSELTTKVLDVAGGEAAADVVIDIWAEARQPQVTRTNQLLTELRSTASPDLAMLAVANRQLKSMVAAGG